MAFVANSLNDPCDKLYAHSGISPDLQGPDVGALGVIDPQTLELSTIAGIDYAWGELTGTGTGQAVRVPGLVAGAPHRVRARRPPVTCIDVLPLPGLQSDSGVRLRLVGRRLLPLHLAPATSSPTARCAHLDFDNSDDGDQALDAARPRRPSGSSAPASPPAPRPRRCGCAAPRLSRRTCLIASASSVSSQAPLGPPCTPHYAASPGALLAPAQPRGRRRGPAPPGATAARR